MNSLLSVQEELTLPFSTRYRWTTGELPLLSTRWLLSPLQEGRILVISPWEKNQLKPIEKAIQASDIGINPTNDGNVIRLAFPQLTEDRRKELCKDIKKLGEESKVAIRSIRRDAMDKLKKMQKNSEITEDDLKDCEKKVQDITDKFCAEADKAVADKEKEIMTV